MVIDNDNALSMNIEGMRQLLDATSDGIFSLDTQGHFLYVNHAFAAMLGREPDALMGQDCQKLGLHFKREQKPALAEIELVNSDGTRHFEYTLNPVLAENGTFSAFVGIMRDIEARRQAEQERNKFLGLLSHELRTPLAAVKGNVQLALRQVKRLMKLDIPAVNEFATKIEGMLTRAEYQIDVESRMVNDMLDVSRIQSNKLEIHARPFDLVELVTTVVANERAAEQTRIVQLVPSTQDSLIVNADADRIEQVLTNYLSNAFKYAPPAKPIIVTIETREEVDTSRAIAPVVRVSVRDEGSGLTPEEQEHIWERFYQTQNRTVLNGQSTGLGLGLYICRVLIERQHGAVGVTSEVGQGSTFWFELPLVSSVAGEQH